jgi:hypothetical protein
MKEEFLVHGRGNFPTLSICLRRLIQRVTKRMNDNGVLVKHVKMNGGAASHIIALKKSLPYNDIDLIFDVDLTSFETVKDCVFASLLEFLPSDVNKDKITSASMKEAYIRKLVKVNDGVDRWSLISLNNDSGRYIELKFVDRMRRQFEFSVDSFQICLDPIVGDAATVSALDNDKVDDISADDERTLEITAESVYGDFRLALRHLNDMLIDTTQPELIRGGGLLKYVNLLIRGYRPARSMREFSRMERYMCSRFFIDFSTWEQQQRKLRTYLDNHFHGDMQIKYEYLLLLHRIVDESTVCLMSHERRLSLNSIEQLAYELNMEQYYQQQMTAAHQHHAYHHAAASSASSTTSTASPSPCPSPSSITSSSCNQHPLYHQHQHHPHCQGSIGVVQGSTTTTDPLATHQPKQTLLFVPHNASYWIPVM